MPKLVKSTTNTNIKFNIVDALRIIILTGLSILIFYPPYARGLFFDKELLPFHIMSFSLFLIFCIYKILSKDYAIFKTPLDYAAAGMVLVYLLPIMFTQVANLRTAIGELLKYCNYFIMYLMIRDTIRSKKQLYMILNVIIFSALGMALIAIDGAAGEKISRIIEQIVNTIPGIDYKIFGTYTNSRMSSMLQYANALASYLLAAFILSTGLIIYTRNNIWKHVYAGVSFVFLLTFIFTYSRGAWLMFPIIYLIFLILLWDVYAIVESILYTGVIGSISLVAIPLLNRFIQEKGISRIWLTIFGGMLVAFIGSYLMGFITAYLRKFKWKQLLVAGGTLILAIIIGCGVLLGIALNVEKPIQLIHEANEKNSTKAVSKVIDNILSNNEYTLRYDAEYASGKENEWAYRITVASVNAENKIENIIETTNIDLDNSQELSFKTLDNTEKIRITIANYYTNTNVTFSNSMLVNNTDNKQNKIIFKYKYIPDSIVSRFDNINLEENSASARFAFYKDALKIIKDHPLFGAGGGGWASLYFMYQSYLYWSTQAHNYFMQVWIETGTLGLLALGAFITMILYTVFRFKKEPTNASENKVLMAMYITAVLSLLGHSMMDFDLSLAAVSLMLWQLIACTASLKDITYHSESASVILSGSEGSKKKHIYEFAGLSILSIAVLALTISLQAGYANAQSAIEKANNNNLPYAVKDFEKAIRFDPFTASYKMDLAQLYNRISVKNKDGKNEITDKEKFDNAEILAEKALKQEPFNSTLYAHAASIYLGRGKTEEGLQYLDKSIQVQPLRIQNYQQKADVYFQLGIMYLNQKKYEEAEKEFEKILVISTVVKGLNQEILKPISLTPEVMEYIERADYLVKNYKEPDGIKKFNTLVFHSYMDADTKDIGVPDTWATWKPKGSDIKTEVTKQNTLTLWNGGKVRGGVITRKFI
ncbi:MAG: O-antigen ligase family protein, partial [Clostridia bacterium]